MAQKVVRVFVDRGVTFDAGGHLTLSYLHSDAGCIDYNAAIVALPKSLSDGWNAVPHLVVRALTGGIAHLVAVVV